MRIRDPGLTSRIRNTVFRFGYWRLLFCRCAGRAGESPALGPRGVLPAQQRALPAARPRPRCRRPSAHYTHARSAQGWIRQGEWVEDLRLRHKVRECKDDNKISSALRNEWKMCENLLINGDLRIENIRHVVILFPSFLFVAAQDP